MRLKNRTKTSKKTIQNSSKKSFKILHNFLNLFFKISGTRVALPVVKSGEERRPLGRTSSRTLPPGATPSPRWVALPAERSTLSSPAPNDFGTDSARLSASENVPFRPRKKKKIPILKNSNDSKGNWNLRKLVAKMISFGS
jgi:hypothetical protein